MGQQIVQWISLAVFFLNGQNCEIVGGIEEVLRQHRTIALKNSPWTALNTALCRKVVWHRKVSANIVCCPNICFEVKGFGGGPIPILVERPHIKKP